jgi:hypothetical protein
MYGKSYELDLEMYVVENGLLVTYHIATHWQHHVLLDDIVASARIHVLLHVGGFS